MQEERKTLEECAHMTDIEATLVLIDPRHVAPYPGSGFFDLNAIPLAAVQSVEVLSLLNQV